MVSKAFNCFLNLQTTTGKLFIDFGYDSLLHIVGHTLYLINRVVTQSCPTLCGRVDCSPPGFSIRGILQARVLEWGASAFSRDIW